MIFTPRQTTAEDIERHYEKVQEVHQLAQDAAEKNNHLAQQMMDRSEAISAR